MSAEACFVLFILLLATTDALFSSNTPLSISSINRPKPPKLGTVRPVVVRPPPASLSLARAASRTKALLPADLRPGASDADLRWFLADRYFDPERSAEKLASMLKWRRRFNADARSVNSAREQRTRKGYLHAHKDKLGRPVVVAVAGRHNVFMRQLPESKLLCTQVLDAALERLQPVRPLPLEAAADKATASVDPIAASASTGDEAAEDWADGGTAVSQIIGVFDLRGLGPQTFDFEFVAFLIETIYRYYPQRLGQVLLVAPPPFVFEAAWKVILPQLGRHADVVRFVSLRELRAEYFTPETLPLDFR